ncbi:hypothetical protein Hanom_Chr13g01227231 [Helianthus anomalus]
MVHPRSNYLHTSDLPLCTCVVLCCLLLRLQCRVLPLLLSSSSLLLLVFSRKSLHKRTCITNHELGVVCLALNVSNLWFST